ncbi:MAG: hypothetical protein CSA53_01675 [Gammaproteobacteria bacterium]|nr:MAG: hypothetical protein CSA53_01675 [Gammaproteobacteria bacterium]
MTHIDPALHTTALAALEGAANKALQLDPQGQEALTALAGHTFHIECTAPPLDLYLQPVHDGLRLLGVWEGEVSTAVRGAAKDFSELLNSRDPAATLINGDLELHGDSAPLLALQKVLSELDIDWEAPLVDALGDVAGHQLASALRSVFNWGKEASQRLQRQAGEFIHEEARLSPPPLELEDFYADIAALKQRIERLQSKTQRLQKRARALRD